VRILQRAECRLMAVHVDLRICLSGCNGIVRRHTVRDKKLSQMCPKRTSASPQSLGAILPAALKCLANREPDVSDGGGEETNQKNSGGDSGASAAFG